MGTNQKQSTENFIKDIHRKTGRLFSFEQHRNWILVKPELNPFC